MYKSVCVLSVVLFLALSQSAVGGFIAYINYSDDNCTTPVGTFYSGGASCPVKRDTEQTDCQPVPDSPYFYREDAVSFCNYTKAPEVPEGWYSVFLYFGLETCTSTKSVNIIHIGLINTNIRMMADIHETGLQPWNVTGTCNNETGIITAKACGKIFGSNFCPSGDFSSDCTYNQNYQAAGYQTGCVATQVPVAPPVSPPATPQSAGAPQAVQPSSTLKSSGAKLINFLAAIAIVAAFI